ncbi:MAG: hypothetical protein ABI567_02580 [Gammaproteobacteria bacterium]
MGVGVIAALIVFWGFSATFFLRDPGAGLRPLSALLLVHGIVFSAWILVFIAQASLVAANRRDLHRRLGAVSVALAAGLVFLGLIASIDALRRGATPIEGLDARSFFAIPFIDILLFAALVGAALYFRRNLETHKRLMVLASISILAAAIARIPLAFIFNGGPPVFFALLDVLVLSVLAYDFFRHGRVHTAYRWGAALLILSQPLRLAVSGTAPWLAFANLFLP